MTLSTLYHQFRVESVPVTVDTESRLNIKKRREKVTYRTLSNRDNINIAYLIGQNTLPSNNLSVSDRSIFLVQNRLPSLTNFTIETTELITLNTDKFLVTDVFTTETPTRPEMPLFFVHKLKNFNDTVSDFANKTLISLEFADYDLTPINITDYILDSSTGELFNNIENSYDDGTGDFSVTFVKYTVRTISGSQQQIDIYHELIDNQTIFTPADFDDIDDYGNLLPDRKKFLVEELSGVIATTAEVTGQQFEIALPEVKQYAYKETPDSRIKVLPPAAIDIGTPWYLRVTNGRFFASLQKEVGRFINYKYQLAEFNSQTFFPFPPYKFQPEHQAVWINDNIIKTPKNITYNENLSLFVEVIVRDNTNALKYVFSNDPGRVGALFLEGLRYTNGISSVDQRNGFIELTDPVRDDDTIIVSYFTEETEYEFTSVNFNPVNNLDILNERVVLYIHPESTLTGEFEKNLYYLRVNALGEIIYNSQVAENPGSIQSATLKLAVEDFDTDGTPLHTFYYDKPSTEAALSSRHSGVNLADIDDFSFVDKYTVESVLLNSQTAPSGFQADNFAENPRFLILADVYVGESQAADSLTRFDVRRQGGGIKDEYREAALEEQPEVSWYWDFNANRPYPSVGAFMAEIPQELFADYGGDFSQDQITDIVQKHMKMGGYAVIKSYGIDPVITQTTAGSGEISFCWPSYGPDVSYNVYYSTDIEIGFSQWNSLPIVDSGVDNCITIDGLSSSTKYFVYVQAEDVDTESKGPTVSITTTSHIV